MHIIDRRISRIAGARNRQAMQSGTHFAKTGGFRSHGTRLFHACTLAGYACWGRPLGRCPNPRRTQKLCSGTQDKSCGYAILQIADGWAAQRCSVSFSRRSFVSSCSLSNSRIRSMLALAVSSSFISSWAFRYSA